MLADFLTDLFEHGKVTVSDPCQPATQDQTLTFQILEERQVAWRQNLPPGQPDFDVQTAYWAAKRLYDAAGCLVHRHVDAEKIKELLDRRKPTPTTAAEHFSADLCLQFMWDIIRLARAASENDPLCDQVMELLKDWPLSAIGTSEAPDPTDVIMHHGGLKQMYLDRIIQRNDTRVMESDVVKSAMREFAGGQVTLLPPSLKSSLQTSEWQDPAQ